MKGNRNGEESLSFGKLQTNSRADALPGPLYSSPGQDQVTERRGGGDRDVPGLCWGSSGQRGDTLSQAGGADPLCLLTCSAHRFILQADALIAAFKPGPAPVMDEPAALPVLAVRAAGHLSNPSCATGPQRPGTPIPKGRRGSGSPRTTPA